MATKANRTIDRFIRWISTHRLDVLSYIIIQLMCIVISSIKNVEEYNYDSLYYWSIADSVISHKGFDLLSYSETFRGYLFPIMVEVFKDIFGGVWEWRILSSIIVASLFGVLFPAFFVNTEALKSQFSIVIKRAVMLVNETVIENK